MRGRSAIAYATAPSCALLNEYIAMDPPRRPVQMTTAHPRRLVAVRIGTMAGSVKRSSLLEDIVAVFLRLAGALVVEADVAGGVGLRLAFPFF